MRKVPQHIAYEYLRDGIISGEFERGERLKSESIAERLGISRMPVREALRQLDAEGLVTLRPNRGAIVTDLSPDDVHELFEMRAVLEALAIQQAAEQVTPEVLLELEQEIAKLSTLRSDPLQWMENHERFHDRLCRLSGRQRMCDQISLIRHQLVPYTRHYVSTVAEPELVGYEHEAILDAMRGRDPVRIERVVRSHILQNAARVVRSMTQRQALDRRAVGASGSRNAPVVPPLG